MNYFFSVPKLLTFGDGIPLVKFINHRRKAFLVRAVTQKKSGVQLMQKARKLPRNEAFRNIQYKNIVTEIHVSVNNTLTQRTYSKNNSENSFSKQLASIAAVGGVR
jgi:hypothetical protein